VKNNLYILPIEPIENRYPGDWYDHVPSQFQNFIDANCLEYNVESIIGEFSKSNSGSSAFLNFIDTNIWKSTQLARVAKLFSDDLVIDGDVFLLTDAWNPCVHQLRYMADLTGKNVKIVGVWHAGSYDKWDILGQTFKNKTWSYTNEAAMYMAYDLNIFATEFHCDMFRGAVGEKISLDMARSVVCGFPMEYMSKIIMQTSEKKDQVIFPHRASREKQHEVAELLAKELKIRGIDMYICQGKNLTRDEYYAKLSESKVCFSASLQETLGIAQFEAMLAGATPIVPDRLSYTEMYPTYYKYPSYITEGKMTQHKINCLADRVVYSMENYDSNSALLIKDASEIGKQFFNGEEFYKTVLEKK